MTTARCEQIQAHGRGFSRRRFLQTVSAGTLAAGTLTLRDLVTLQAAELRRQGKSVILLWMGGGPSQFETFDPKPGTDSGGPTQAISTSVSGIQIAQGWDKTAQVMDDIAIIRSMTNKEGSHPRATYQMHTGFIPSGSVKHPSFAANVARELADPESELPAVVSVGATQGAGFLGVNYEPFVVSNPGSMPQNVARTVESHRYRRRLGLLDQLEEEFAEQGGGPVVENHRQLYGKTSRMVLSADLKSFDISGESQRLKDSYGDNIFGRGCLLARRLIEQGTTFVEISSRTSQANWDTHQDNFERTAANSAMIDPAYSTLIRDLKDRGLFSDTVVLWLGEFGRSPKINARGGRDHYPRVFNAAVAGGGMKGGQVIGASTRDGSAVERDPVTPGDLFASVCRAINVDPTRENMSPLGRPMRIVDKGEVIKPLF